MSIRVERSIWAVARLLCAATAAAAGFAYFLAQLSPAIAVGG